MRPLWLAAIPVAMCGSLFGLVVLVDTTPQAQAESFCVTQPNRDALATFDDEQLANAATIIEVGRSRNVPPNGWVVALAAALQESSLRNLPYGDRDSAGLFQMRPSMGWGSYEQVTEPEYAATAFFGGPHQPPANDGLLDIDRWEEMPITAAAQAVERSAFPDAYAKWVDPASTLVHRLSGESLDCESPADADCPPSDLPVEVGLTPNAQRVARCAVAHFDIDTIGGRATAGHVTGSDHYTGRAVDLMIDDWLMTSGVERGDQAATYFISHAEEFGITYIIWRAEIWTTERPYWRPYSHPGGRTDPTALHMDHLHISVAGSATTTTKESSS